LRDLDGRPEYERREALEDLGSRLAALVGDGPLRELAEALRPEAIQRRPFEELWAYALQILDAMAGPTPGPAQPDRGSSFWRRP
jgi:hypothetical protein